MPVDITELSTGVGHTVGYLMIQNQNLRLGRLGFRPGEERQRHQCKEMSPKKISYTPPVTNISPMARRLMLSEI